MTAGTLPPLRADLDLIRGQPDWDGAPTWTLYDQSRDRFYRLGLTERAMLAHWHLGQPHLIAQAVRENGTILADQDILDFAHFLDSQHLTLRPPAMPRARSWLSRLAHGYLFFRIPLGSPDPLAKRIQPPLSALAGYRATPLIVALLTVLAMIQTGRSWDVFWATLPPLASPSGLALFALMLLVASVVHEMGHAVAARHYGIRSGEIGIAFLVMVPTLYTDATRSWGLPHPRHRLVVGLAGIGAESLLALAALLAWPHLPPGPFSQAAVAYVTVSMVTTLTINLNPLMRFDGYYLLSDLLGLPNLQDRAFARLIRQIRFWVLGWLAPDTDPLPPRLALAALAWAWVALFYRAALYLGIALLVYHAASAAAGKLVGGLLLGLEIWWFMIWPMGRILADFWRHRALARPLALGRLGVLMGGLILLLAVPWNHPVHLPAVLETSGLHVLYPPQAGFLERLDLTDGQQVTAGQRLAFLASPNLDARARAVDVKLAQARWNVDHLNTQAEAWSRIQVERQMLEGLQHEQMEVEKQRRHQEIHAPFAGLIRETDPALSTGGWVGRTTRLGIVIQPDRCRIRALAREDQMAALEQGALGRFHPDPHGMEAVNVRLERLDPVPIRRLDDPYFLAEWGGAVPVRADVKTHVPEIPMFGVGFNPTDATTCPMRVRGTISVQGKARSLAARAWDHAWSTLNRELEFRG